jgi:hypothetical protein
MGLRQCPGVASHCVADISSTIIDFAQDDGFVVNQGVCLTMPGIAYQLGSSNLLLRIYQNYDQFLTGDVVILPP